MYFLCGYLDQWVLIQRINEQQQIMFVEIAIEKGNVSDVAKNNWEIIQ